MEKVPYTTTEGSNEQIDKQENIRRRLSLARLFRRTSQHSNVVELTQSA